MLYGNKPAQFVATWRKFADAFRTGAPHAALVWAPNFFAGEGDDYAPYWPGADYVDWVALR
jgi:beta-mannanase